MTPLARIAAPILAALPLVAMAAAEAVPPPDPGSAGDAAADARAASTASADAAGRTDPLLWPTDAGRCVTSTFCEFRPDHFHSGIDISTWGKTGYRCLAAGDGELVRARVSCGGYGRSLYLRLEDGRTVVYAHLSRFEGALDDTVRARQEAAGTPWVDLELPAGAFPVRRGDTVARTGQSGVGVPHLHVEVRDADQRPLDPLTAGFVAPDGIAPVVTRVALTPLDPASSVDGRSETVILDVLPGDRPGVGRLARTIPVEGEIGIALEIDETQDLCRWRHAPRRLELREGGVLLRGVDYASFSFDETGLMDLQIDPRFSYSKVGRFHLLWRRPGNDLPFGFGPAGADGVIRAGRVPPDDRRFLVPARESPGGPPRGGLPRLDSVQDEGERVRTLEALAFDAAGNRGAVEIVLSFAAPPTLAVLDAERVPGPRDADAAADTAASAVDLTAAWTDTVVVHGAVRAGGRPLREVRLDVSWDGGATWLRQAPVLPDPDGSFDARLAVRRLVPGSGGRAFVVRARAVDALGAAGLAASTGVGPPPPHPPSADFEIVTVGPWIELRFGERVPFAAAGGGWEARSEEDGGGWAAVLVRPWGDGVRVVVPGSRGGAREWDGRGGPWAGWDPWGRPVALAFAEPAVVGAGHSGATTAADGASMVRFDPGSFREPVVPLLRTEPPPLPAGELRPVGPLRVLETGHVPPAGDWELRVEVPDGAEAPDSGHVALFVQDDGGFRYIGGETDPATGELVVRTRTLLPVGPFLDATPPTLGDPRLETVDGRLRLALLVEDRGAGVDCDGVQISLDGAALLVETDDETGDVVARVPGPPASGAGGLFEIRATDRTGNVAHRSVEVRLP